MDTQLSQVYDSHPSVLTMGAMNYPNQLIQEVRDIINDECIIRAPEGSRELPSLGGGGHYIWQFYLRRALLDPRCLRAICNDFWAKNGELFERHPFQIAGVESASVPLITAIVIDGSQRGYTVNAFTIRKQRKEYGLRNLIEGCPTDVPVLIVDDLTSPQHNSFWHAIHAITLHRLPLLGLGYVLVLKKKADESRVIPTSFGPVLIQSLYTLSDFSMTPEEYQAEKQFLGIVE